MYNNHVTDLILMIINDPGKDLSIPLRTTANGQRSFSDRGLAVWNKRGHETAPSLAILKNFQSLFIRLVYL